MWTPQQFSEDFIFRWEDGQSRDPNKTHSLRRTDRGNWTGMAIGSGRLVGSNHGVTAVALAAYRRVSIDKITVEVMRALTLAEAGQIALADFFRAPGLDRLDWNALTASLFDFGWGAGQKTAIMKYQRMLGVADDGAIGMLTDKAGEAFVAKHGIEKACRLWAAQRLDYYERVIKAHPEQAENRNGWANRTNSFLPGGKDRWWERFHA